MGSLARQWLYERVIHPLRHNMLSLIFFAGILSMATAITFTLIAVEQSNAEKAFLFARLNK